MTSLFKHQPIYSNMFASSSGSKVYIEKDSISRDVNIIQQGSDEKNAVQCIVLKKLFSDDIMKNQEGNFFDVNHYFEIIDYDCDVYIDNIITECAPYNGSNQLHRATFLSKNQPKDVTTWYSKSSFKDTNMKSPRKNNIKSEEVSSLKSPRRYNMIRLPSRDPNIRMSRKDILLKVPQRDLYHQVHPDAPSNGTHVGGFQYEKSHDSLHTDTNKNIIQSNNERSIIESTSIKDNSEGKRRLLFKFRKARLPKDLTSQAFQNLLPIAQKSKTNNRGIASGKVDPSRISGNIIGITSPNRHRTSVIFADGRESSYTVANSVSSFIAGYYDKPIRRLATPDYSSHGKKYPCRLTSFSRNHVKEWHQVLPLIEYIDNEYSIILPDKYEEQKKLTQKIPDFTIGSDEKVTPLGNQKRTIFTTITVNYNWRTATHIDKGDLQDAYSVLTVCERGQWSGCYLGYPQYGVCINVREGDILIMDPHEYHCNTELHLESPDAVRLSLIIYCRQGILKCTS